MSVILIVWSVLMQLNKKRRWPGNPISLWWSRTCRWLRRRPVRSESRSSSLLSATLMPTLGVARYNSNTHLYLASLFSNIIILFRLINIISQSYYVHALCATVSLMFAWLKIHFLLNFGNFVEMGLLDLVKLHFCPWSSIFWTVVSTFHWNWNNPFVFCYDLLCKSNNWAMGDFRKWQALM